LTSVLTVPDGVEYQGFVALVANGTRPSSRITPISIVGPASAPAAGSAVTVTISSVTPAIPIRAGTWLELLDPTGATGTVLAQVATTFVSGTSLILNMKEAPAANFTARWPSFIDLLTDFGQTNSLATNSVSTFDHRRINTRQVSRGDADNSYSLGGVFSDYSAGQKTLEYAVANGQDVYIERRRANPNSAVFTANPPLEFGVGVVTEFSITPTDGQANFTSGVAVNGGFTIVEAAAT
jgi:hypothetical protein